MNKPELAADFLHLMKKHIRSKEDMQYLAAMAIAALVDDEEDHTPDEPTGESSFIVINGNNFRCSCGCNVFSKMKSGNFQCNACPNLYESA